MVTQTNLSNHPGMWLAPDAAASFERMEAANGVIEVNQAGRSDAEQQELIDRWNAGGAANRPPYLYQPAPMGVSWHQKGEAFDTNNPARMKSIGPAFGWTFDIPGDAVHFQYHPSLDQHAGGSAPSSTDTSNRQTWLNASRGAGLVVDGIAGPATIAAYKAYQSFLRAYGYTGAIDGIWGSGTQAAHEAFYASQHSTAPVPAAPGAPLSYSDIQTGLNKFGYGLSVDGVWGPASHNALGDFQSKHGLSRDFLVGPATRAALGI